MSQNKTRMDSWDGSFEIETAMIDEREYETKINVILMAVDYGFEGLKA